MSEKDRIEDLEQPDADSVKGGIGVNVKHNDRSIASADATAQGTSVSAGDTSAAAGATVDDGNVDINVDLDR